MVRLVPKRPRPDVSWDEWDGLLRICFVRKNRTLRAGFLGTTTIMDMLEANYRTWCAQNDIAVEDGPPNISNADTAMDLDTETQAMETEAPPPNDDGDEEEAEWEGIMDVDDVDTPAFFQDELDDKAKALNAKAGGTRKKKGKVAEMVREKVRRVLEEETGLADKRARMCDESDFLRLLWAFNKEGIHFC